MKVHDLLREFFPNASFPTFDVSVLTESSRLADAGAVFVCIRGARADGHAFAKDAYHRGCRVFIAESELSLPEDAYVYLCTDTRRLLALLAAKFYGDPSKKMHLIGITGTKGKTTTAQLLCHILNRAQIPCGYIGTNGISYGDVTLPTANTTPDAVTLQKTLSQMLKKGITTAVIEVSSQAILQSRVLGTRLQTSVFTNLFPDHIGTNEHPDFENYKECKHRLFTDFGVENIVYNADDPAASDMLDGATAKKLLSCSSAVTETDFFVTDPALFDKDQSLGISFTLGTKETCIDCKLPLTGRINACNALLAAAVACGVFGIPLSHVANTLTEARVSGRSEVLSLPNGARAVIDYAHNGESLSKLLSSLREYAPHRLIVLFGSVGERSQMRRAELGQAAAKYADLAILTSDNPGVEDPNAIIADIAKAFADTSIPYLAIADREEAIRTAVNLTVADDILVLAGKGHEAYQLIGTQKLPFCERKILLEAVQGIMTAT